MYLYLTSNELLNGKCRFTLPTTILEYEYISWNVGLLDIVLPPTSTPFTSKYIDVLTNICKPSIVGPRLAPILNRIHIEQMGNNGYVSFDSPRYIHLSTTSIDYIDIILADDNGKAISFEDSTLTCTLQFIQNN